ncbi:MAG: restriction endonuclease subunit S [Mesorhizobium sp.]|uniref:restriction endonuclease subunit S n=1 Tax=Mesorhizobium sp. TaxID=1871066 RepID=UPI000FE88961|nr:restriction endonuclease subunit S [Mesorhizobium sp.]RWH84357.1 MAG: restriction endonuclease subunit S [Mesorhizobium sp.]RWH86743.1 MAG: restriction endonuclease subunit S [Mesorhizobium sp.]RWH93719.1 MAG: restriction endonuclease subunit S [Mesorhizobium sp.]RWI02824.1 MAG: restriction endonuclease subunit S [Mesorhizobium sp.]RWI05334.1 MAG: restriction endonuclease subunit S [Mesorhizobium sp.]
MIPAAEGSSVPSRISWIGDIPEGWSVKRFRYVFKESSEKIETEVVGEMLSVSGYRGIEIKEYDDDNRRRSADDLVGYRIVRPGQLVVNTMWLNYAGLGVSAFEGYVSPAYRSYDFLQDVDRRYIHYLMRCSIYVQSYTRLLTGIRPNSLQMSREDLMDFPVLLPPLSEQAAIAAFLDRETGKINVLVEEQKRLIELLKEKRQAVISHSVTNGLNPNVLMKASGVEWLGDVPEHWEVSPLKRLWSVTDCKHVTAEFVDDGVPVASIRECQAKFIDLIAAKQTTDEFYEVLIDGGRKPQSGDLIFTRNATVGEVSQVAEWHPNFAMGQDVCLLRKTSVEQSTDFLQYVLEATSTTQQLDVLMIGSTFKRVNVEEIRNLRVPFPPPIEQAEIVQHLDDKVGTFDDLIAEAERAVGLLRERRAALTSAAVTGKIDVRNLASEKLVLASAPRETVPA